MYETFIDLDELIILCRDKSAKKFIQEAVACYRAGAYRSAKVDVIHIAAATVHGMDYLLTWNCKHIANAQIQGKLAEISLDFSYVLAILCTPNELMGD